VPSNRVPCPEDCNIQTPHAHFEQSFRINYLESDNDKCPRCSGSFKETGGKPNEPPMICQKCWYEIKGSMDK
jgi:hypothetical protein